MNYTINLKTEKKMDFNNMQTKERINFWKYVLVSVIWSLLAFAICGYVFEVGVGMMSRAKTISFIGGFILVAVAIVVLFFILDYHYFKIKKFYGIKKSQDNKSKSYNENQPNSGNS